MSGAGVALGSSDYSIEANAYLQGRLRIIYAFSFVAAALFLGLDFASELLVDGSKQTFPKFTGRIIHGTGLILLLVHYLLLRRRSYSKFALRYFDAFMLLGTMAICLGIYLAAIGYPGAYRLPWIASLLVVARGFAVPSSVRWTLLLSLAAPIGLLLVRAFRPIDQAYETVQLVWDSSVMCLGVALATLASWITFRLREEAAVARRLGQYQVEEKLGEGAMGTVYRATHHMLRRPTAIKVLRPELAGLETVARFEREVRQTALLEHPNTIRIFDYGRTPEGNFYYAMELLDGEDLERILADTGPLPPARVLHILRQVCDSLQEAHAAGLVHRDVKLGNIVLCRRAGLHDVAKVLDFGLVKDLRNESVNVTQAGMLCGTPETIAPEVLRGESATARSDLYAIGIAGYQLLTGELPYEASTAAELISAHLSAEPRAFEGELGGVLARCLAKEPAARPATAAELRDLLGPSEWSEADAAAWWRSYRAP